MKRGRAALPKFPPKPPPKKEPTKLQVRFPNEPPMQGKSYVGLFERLQHCAQVERESLNEVILFFLDWAVDDWEKDQARNKKK